MLIVNGDDLGLRGEVTDAILECWEAGAISSASAMVHMADSARACRLAAEAGLPIGLHLNLTTEFTAADVPGERALRQRRAVAYFAGPARRRFGFDPRARPLLELCVADQLDAFAELCGVAASHADGHQHIQTCPTVLSTPSLGAVASLRRAHGFVAGRRSLWRRLYRGAVNAAIRGRFRSVPFVSLRDFHPALGGVGLDRLFSLAARGDVEAMVHPAWDDEREVLLSAAWRRELRGVKIGSHADLA
jgi:predicted glycoside hydrolase/deacetylase ChbG (UPF0249 family)